jgi:hypothetical protein
MNPNPDEAMHRVVFAQWDSEMLLYTVTLDCGHIFECSSGMLTSQMVCMECFRAMLHVGEAIT